MITTRHIIVATPCKGLLNNGKIMTIHKTVVKNRKQRQSISPERTQYLVALGSNQRHVHYGGGKGILIAAIERLTFGQNRIVARSRFITSKPLGPSLRTYTNAVLILESALKPGELIRETQNIERSFGRRLGQKWSRRVLDIDLILWNKGRFRGAHPPLIIPHISYASRLFVVAPAAEIAGDWRDPECGLRLFHLHHRLNRAKPLDHEPKRH